MQGVMDFLSFRYFISFPVLLACYYLGVVGIPLMSWYVTLWVKRKHWIVSDPVERSSQQTLEHRKHGDKAAFMALLLFLFLSMEIIWRVIFEFLIAYLQMRSALMILTEF